MIIITLMVKIMKMVQKKIIIWYSDADGVDNDGKNNHVYNERYYIFISKTSSL